MQTIIKVPTDKIIFRKLRPYNVDDLIRLGGFNDGGYVVPRRCLTGIASYVNFGVGENFEFEIELLSFGIKKIKSFDSLVSLKYVCVNSIKGWLKFMLGKASIRIVSLRFRIMFRFVKFYYARQEISFIKAHVNESIAEEVFLKLSSKSALKVDIEGDEYKLLNTIRINREKFNFFIIEFHFIEQNQDKIIEFIDNISDKFYIAHSHFNNYTSNINALPQTVEVTFCRKDVQLGERVTSIPDLKLDWHFPDKPVYIFEYS